MKLATLFSLVLFVACIIQANTIACAQEKVDVVSMLNGEEKEGKVTGITAETIKFKYRGEDLEYEFKKTEVRQIKFSSGRIEVFTKVEGVAPSGDKKNKVAVVPAKVVTNDQSVSAEEMGLRIQSASVNFFRHDAPALVVQDEQTTNAILARNKIDPATLRTMVPRDLADMLGVEYVAFITVDVMNNGTYTSGTGVSSYKDKENTNHSATNKNTKESGVAVSSSSSSTQVMYSTKVELTIFNDQGGNVYSESRSPFGSDLETYNSGLEYMIKRTPFGTKAKH